MSRSSYRGQMQFRVCGSNTCSPQSVPVDARSKAWVCDRSLAGIVGSNPAGGMVVCCQAEVSATDRSEESYGCLSLRVLCLSARGLCDKPIPLPEESYGHVFCERSVVSGSGVPRGVVWGVQTPPPKFRNFDEVPKIKKILLYEMKFLVPNYSCLQNP
jgi:hypothetical protein